MMNIALLLLIEIHTDRNIKQTKTQPQKTFEFKLKQQMRTFSFNPPMNLSNEVKWLLAVTTFEATNSGFNKTDEYNSFSVSTPKNGPQKLLKKVLTK